MFSLADVAADRRRMEGKMAIGRKKMMKMYEKCLQIESGMLNIDFFQRLCETEIIVKAESRVLCSLNLWANACYCVL